LNWAVKETQAWTLFEILEVLHERVEREWTRYGRMRNREESMHRQPKRRSPKPSRKVRGASQNPPYR
jgi:hypothetical protein